MVAAMFTAFQAAPYVMAVALGLLVPLIGVVCYANFSAGLAVIVGMFAVEAVSVNVGGLQLGVSIYYTDLVLVFIALIGALRLLTSNEVPRRHWAWNLYLLAFAVSLCAGLITYGSGAGVQSRGYFYSLAAGSYALSFTVNERKFKNLVTALGLLALLMVCLCIYRWIVYYTPIRELLPEGGTYNIDGPIRVIKSHETLVLGQLLVMGLFFASMSRTAAVARVFSPGLLAAVVTLQHRSVWLAVIVGVLASVFVVRSKTGSRLMQALLVTLIVFATALPLVFSEKLGGVGADVKGSATTAIEGSGTVSERADNWQSLLRLWLDGGPRSIVLGQSFGSDSTRYVRDQTNGGERKIQYYAHNHYVQTVYNMGLVGLVAFLSALAYAVRGLYQICASGKGSASAEALLVLLIMQAVYYVPYGTDYLQTTILGMAMAFVATHQKPAAAAKPGMVRVAQSAAR